MSIPLKLDDDLKSRIQHLAEVRHRSANWIMQEAIKNYVDREEQREALKKDALQAWASYKEDGLHLTLEEADAWLAKLESGEDTGMPECHV
jgi:predicted transcriptional regulator